MQRTCFLGSPDSQFSLWLMIVSRQTAVLPVWRSPMISWRWPRPIAIMASIALMPVCIGSLTGWRCTTVGACSSRARRPSASIGPRPSIGLPSGSTTRPRKRVADGDREDLAGAAHRLALLDLANVAEEDDTDLADVEVQGEAEEAVLELQQLVGHRRVETLDARDAVTGLHDATDLFAGGARRVRRDVPLDRIPDLFRPDRQLRHGVLLSFSARGAGDVSCR